MRDVGFVEVKIHIPRLAGSLFNEGMKPTTESITAAYPTKLNIKIEKRKSNYYLYCNDIPQTTARYYPRGAYTRKKKHDKPVMDKRLNADLFYYKGINQVDTPQ